MYTPVFAGQWEYYIPIQGIEDIAFLNGKLYCAAGSGLFILDQNNFTYSRVTRVEGFPATAANRIVHENDNTLLVATYIPGDTQRGSGLYRYNLQTDTWRLFNNPYPGGNRQQPYVQDIVRDGEGSIWLIGDGLLFRVISDSLVQQTAVNGLPVGFIPISLDVDKQGELYLSCKREGGSSIVKREKGTWKVLLDQPGFALGNLTLAPDGMIWFSLSTSLYSYDFSEVKDYNLGGSISGVNVGHVTATSDNSIWCFTHENHIYRVSRGIIEDKTDSFRQALLSAIAPHSFFGFTELYANGSDLWVSADCGEVYANYSVLGRYSEDKWSFFVPEPNLIYPYHVGTPGDIAVGDDGSLWMAGWFTMWPQPAVRFHDGTWSLYRDIGWINDIAVGGTDCMWFFGRDVRYYRNGEWTTFRAQDYPIFEDVLRAGTATSKQAWAGDGHGNVYRYEFGGEWIKYASGEIGVDYVTSIAADDKRGVWVTGWKGTAYFDGDKWKLYTGSTIGLPVRDWNYVSFGVNNDVWFASNIGLIRFDGVSWTVFATMNDGLPNNMVNHIMIDRNRNFWISTDSGLCRFDGIKLETFTRENSPIPSGRIVETAEAPDGSIWIAGAGLYHYIPETSTSIDENDPNIPKPVVIAGNYPNPFNPSTTIVFNLSAPGKTTLVVYDIMGRSVRKLVSEQTTAGAHSILWDGRDDSGRSVSSGVYIAKLYAGNHTAVKKMLLMK